jgi:hypothetical protein
VAKTFQPDALAVALAARNRAFETDDYAWARRMMPTASNDAVILMAFHKARYECRAVSAKKRRESQMWMVENHVRRMTGDFVIPGEPLPR